DLRSRGMALSAVTRPGGPVALASPLRWAALLAAALALTPLAAVVDAALGPGADSLSGATFARYAGTSAALAGLVALGAGGLGGAAAWLVALHRFPGRDLFAWALVLPLAAPAFALAYAYADLFDVAGPIRTAWRGAFGWDPPLEMRSLWGAGLVLSLAFYPYVYLTLRAALLNRSVAAVEAARTLGRTRGAALRAVALPMARPALAAGLALALMETLADYGAVSFLGVQTLTTGVVRAWSIFGSTAEAARLALPLLGAAAVLMWLERATRRGRSADVGAVRWRAAEAPALPPLAGWAATLFCLSLIGLGLLLPAGWLAWKAQLVSPEWPRLLAGARNAFALAGAAAGLAAALAAALALATRGRGLLARLVSLGYATP